MRHLKCRAMHLHPSGLSDIFDRKGAGQGLVSSLFRALSERLSASQQDQEVKDAGIACAGACVARLGDLSPKETSSILQASGRSKRVACQLA